MPKVSVIINCHNGERFLKDTIESINNQSFQDYEIVFWDNASDDKSAEIVKKIRKKKFKIFLFEGFSFSW